MLRFAIAIAAVIYTCVPGINPNNLRCTGDDGSILVFKDFLKPTPTPLPTPIGPCYCSGLFIVASPTPTPTP